MRRGRLERFGRGVLRAVSAIDAAGPRARREPSRRSPDSPDGHRHAAQRAAGLGRATARRHAAAARAPDRARRLLPRPPPPARRRRRGCVAAAPPAARSCWRGCGCARSALAGALDPPGRAGAAAAADRARRRDRDRARRCSCSRSAGSACGR